MVNKKYDKAFKESIGRLSLEEGRTLSSISKEYNIAKSTINGWIKGFSEEYMESEEKISQSVYEENKKLKKRAAELEKENAFLKKAAAFF
ncbi:transposase, partial [Clostridium algidicarnis]|uniref:transposase n=1 Tax=Clostridium algidicarnis TaxID=37659 RepID=UPI001C0C305F